MCGLKTIIIDNQSFIFIKSCETRQKIVNVAQWPQNDRDHIIELIKSGEKLCKENIYYLFAMQDHGENGRYIGYGYE